MAAPTETQGHPGMNRERLWLTLTVTLTCYSYLQLHILTVKSQALYDHGRIWGLDFPEDQVEEDIHLPPTPLLHRPPTLEYPKGYLHYTRQFEMSYCAHLFEVFSKYHFVWKILFKFILKKMLIPSPATRKPLAIFYVLRWHWNVQQMGLFWWTISFLLLFYAARLLWSDTW